MSEWRGAAPNWTVKGDGEAGGEGAKRLSDEGRRRLRAPRKRTGSTGQDAEIRAALAAERAATLDQMAALRRDFDGIVDSSALVATDDEHDPEGATIAFERAQLAALLDQAQQHLADLDRALSRLSEGSYGRCERCGQPIAPARLAARPAARTCIACAQRPDKHSAGAPG